MLNYVHRASLLLSVCCLLLKSTGLSELDLCKELPLLLISAQWLMGNII